MAKTKKEPTEENRFGLNIQQQLYCEDYINTLNQTRSYMKIYGKKYEQARNPACMLMKNPNVQAYIKFLKEKRAKEMKLDKPYVLAQALKTFQKCQEAEPVLEWNPEERRLVETGEYKFDSKGSVAALDLISRLCGFNDAQKVELSGALGVAQTIIKDDVE